MKYVAIYLDCCLSDFFQGFDGPVLNVPVDNETTYGELQGDLLRELQGYDACYYEASLGEPFDWDAAQAAIVSLFNEACANDKVAEAKYADRYQSEHDWRVAVSKEETKLGYDDWKEQQAELAEKCYFFIGLRPDADSY